MAKTGWTEEEKQAVIEKYQSMNPTAENTSELVKEIADSEDRTTNAVRMMLVKAEVYVNKEPPKAEKKAGSKRVNKEEAHAEVTAAIEDVGLEVDGDIISKMTGKAALYFANVIRGATLEEDVE